MSTATIVSKTPPTFGEEALRSHPGRAGEPVWLGEQRDAAFASYDDLLNRPLDPEEWKRVDLRSFQPGKFRLVDASALSAQFQSLMDTRAEFAGIASHVDGHRVESRLDPALASRGVLFGSLHELAQSHGDLLKAKLFSAVRPDADRMAAWHAAFLTGGTVLYVPRNVELKAPLYSLIGLDQAGAADFSHTLVILEDGAQATLLEETASTTSDRPGLHVGCVELLVGQGARLRYVQLQNWNQQTFHFAHQKGTVARDASLQWTVGGIGSRLSHVHQDVVLDGPGASGEVNGCTFATHRQLLSYYTQQTHRAVNTRSDLLYKDVLRDEARVVWRGMIRVDPGAQQTDGYQRNDSLLLSPEARVDSIPGLEIEADDVRCTHGSTAGRIDEDQIFYLMCRGISRYEAMHMIVEGFFHSIYDRIAVDVVRETLSRSVERKLGIGL